MTEKAQRNPTKRAPRRWAVLLIGIGTALAAASGVGLFLMPSEPAPVLIAETPSPTVSRPITTATQADQPLVQRQIVQPPTREIPPTATASPTSEPGTEIPEPTHTAEPIEAAQPTIEGTPITFTSEE